MLTGGSCLSFKLILLLGNGVVYSGPVLSIAHWQASPPDASAGLVRVRGTDRVRQTCCGGNLNHAVVTSAGW